MAVDAFLQFTTPGDGSVDLNGETKDETIGKELSGPKPFEIKDWSFGVNQTLNIGSASGGAGAGKANFDPFHVKKNIDVATPYLFKTCCVGGHYKDVTLAIRRAGGTAAQSGMVYLKFFFKLVAVSKISWAHDEQSPTEDIDFEYGALKFQYIPQKQSGGQDTSNKAEAQWDRVLNGAEFSAGL